MTVYVVLICLIIIFGLYTDKEIIQLKNRTIINPNINLIIFSIILFLLSALRVNIGTDYRLYNGIYDGAAEKILEMGIGFEYISDFFRALNANFQFFIAFNSLIFISTITYFIFKNSEYKYISLVVLLGSYMYFSSLNGFRQFTSISLVIISIILMNKGKLNNKIIGSIVYIIAVSIHKSSLMYLPFLFVKYIPIKKNLYLFIMVLCLPGFLIIPESFRELVFNKVLNMNSFFSEKYTGSIHTQGEVRGITNKLFFLFYWVLTIKLIFFKMKQKKELFWAEKIFLCYFIVNALMPYSNLVIRICYLLELMAVYIVPKTISTNKSMLVRNIFKLIIIAVYLIRLLYVLYQNGDGVVPYHNVFE